MDASQGDVPTVSYTFSRATQPHAEHPEHNEDTILIDRRNGLVAVFDGVGGSRAGEVASRLAAQSIQRGWKRYCQSLEQSSTSVNVTYPSGKLDEVVRQLIEDANHYILTESAKQLPHEEDLAEVGSLSESPETTLAMLVFCQRKEETQASAIICAHVGDSRIYLLRPNEPLRRLTEDDGYLSILLKRHEITPEDARRIDQTTQPDELTEEEQVYFSRRNGITQSLGDGHPVTVHINQYPLAPGDILLLCTDGIHDNLTDAEIYDVLTHSGRTRAALRLVQRATQRSQEPHLRAKKDDMSAVVVSYGT